MTSFFTILKWQVYFLPLLCSLILSVSFLSTLNFELFNDLFHFFLVAFIKWGLHLYLNLTEVEPISTYVDYGEKEFLVADERGYEHLLYEMAETFLSTSEGKIVDGRLKLNTV